jgi:flagellar biosynthesis chaperone FliJ
MKRFLSSATRLLSLARQRLRLCELIVARARAADSVAEIRLTEAEAACQAAEHALQDGLCRASSVAALQSLQQVYSTSNAERGQRNNQRTQTAADLAAAIRELHAQQSRTESLSRLDDRLRGAWRRDGLRELSHGIDEQAGRQRWLERAAGVQS